MGKHISSPGHRHLLRNAGAVYKLIQLFFRVEAASSIVLLTATCIAIFWANSRWSFVYRRIWYTPFFIFGEMLPPLSLHFLITEGLMSLFFLMVGIDIRKEFKQGQLALWKHASLPLFGALGGMLAPALVYSCFNYQTSGQHGWGIPTATDIAFALGTLLAFGKRTPPFLRTFLLTFAVLDDVGAIVLIALCYSSSLYPFGALGIGAGLLLLWILRKWDTISAWVYMLPGALIWVGFWKLGVHPTIAGVVLGFTTPTNVHRQLEARLHPWVAFVIVPFFALASAGIDLKNFTLQGAVERNIVTGIALGLVVGKPIGIIGMSALALRVWTGRWPSLQRWKHITLAGMLGGIGFTMSLFISVLAFEDPQHLASAKLGILLGSTVAAAAGILLGYLLLPATRSYPVRADKKELGGNT